MNSASGFGSGPHSRKLRPGSVFKIADPDVQISAFNVMKRENKNLMRA
jgi:hypothetical protein